MPQLENSSPYSFAEKSMHFWGVCCESGKRYEQVVGQRFRVTMAVLDPNSFSSDVSNATVSLLVIRGGIEYLLCVLNHESIPQVNLNLIFDKGENVTFYINGHGRVCLSGYQLTDSMSDVLNDENGYLCPLVEVKSSKSKKEKKKKASDPQEQSTSDEVSPQSKKKKKAPKEATVWKTFLNKSENGEILDSDDESDEDYALEEDSDEDDLDILEEEEMDEYEEEEDEMDENEEEEEEEDSDEEEKELEEPISTSKNNQKKRKLETSIQFQKRSRKSSGTFEDPVEVQDNGSKDDTSESDDAMNSSIGNTPMPKKQVIQTSTEKKKKKKKKLIDIANMSSKSVKDNMQSSALGSSPLGAQNTPSKKQILSDVDTKVEIPNKGPLTTKVKDNMKSPAAVKSPKGAQNTPYKVQKLDGGVEIQDVLIGKGPVATKGKLVHVFYVGRFLDNKIFDSRLPQSKPFSFKLGHNQVIKGWDIGLQGMRVGGKRKLIVPPKMAYGNSSVGNIPPNSTLQFIVELQAVS